MCNNLFIVVNSLVEINETFYCAVNIKMRNIFDMNKKDDRCDCRLPSYKSRYNHTITHIKKYFISSHAIYYKSISISNITTCP